MPEGCEHNLSIKFPLNGLLPSRDPSPLALKAPRRELALLHNRQQALKDAGLWDRIPNATALTNDREIRGWMRDTIDISSSMATSKQEARFGNGFQILRSEGWEGHRGCGLQLQGQREPIATSSHSGVLGLVGTGKLSSRVGVTGLVISDRVPGWTTGLPSPFHQGWSPNWRQLQTANKNLIAARGGVMGAIVFLEPVNSVEVLKLFHAKKDSLVTQLFDVDQLSADYPANKFPLLVEIRVG